MALNVPSLSLNKKPTEREKLEKDQAEAIAKAVNPIETAVKEKHIRSAIIGTWQEKGAGIFWACVGKMPLPSQVIMCWKAMFLIHKLLREGHPMALQESFKYRHLLKDLYQFWQHSPKGGYGVLIAFYLKVLIAKLDFHEKNSFIPGTLKSSTGGNIQYPSTDDNDYFQLSVELFDYMDTLIELERKIFETLDRYRSNSQIQAVQCRICPFPVIIQECSGLYTISVDLMYRLHSHLPDGTLSGHRDRFYKQFKELRSFYFDAGNMSYVKALVIVPTLTDNPPSFIASGSQGVLLRSTSYEGPKKEKATSRDPKRQSLMEPLAIAMTEPVVKAAAPLPGGANLLGLSMQDGPPPPPRSESLPDSRDTIIAQLRQEITDLRQELGTQKAYAEIMEESLRADIIRLEEQLAEYENISEKTCEENVMLRKELEGKEEDKKGASEEKFSKLKQMYSKLREEHIQLLRGPTTPGLSGSTTVNSEVKQKLNASEKSKTEFIQKAESLQQELEEKSTELLEVYQISEMMEQGKKVAEATVERLTNEHEEKGVKMTTQLQAAARTAEEIEKEKKAKEIRIDELEKEIQAKTSYSEIEITELTQSMQQSEEQRKTAEATTEKERKEHMVQLTMLNEELDKLTKSKKEEQAARTTAEDTTQKERAEFEKKIATLNEEKDKKVSALNTEMSGLSKRIQDTEEARAIAEKTIENMTKEHEDKLLSLTVELQNITNNKQDVDEARRTAEETIERERNEHENKVTEQTQNRLEDEVTNCHNLIVVSIEEAKRVIQDSLDQFDNPQHSSTTCTAEYLLSRLHGTSERLDHLLETFTAYQSNHKDVVPLVTYISSFSHHLGECLVNAKSTSHMAPPKEAEELTTCSESAGKTSLELLEAMKTRDTDPQVIACKIDELKKHINNLSTVAEELAPTEKDSADAIGSAVDEEINATAELVADAAARIEEMLNKTREKYTGIQLEVNGRILDSCTALMQAIKVLIIKSKGLQQEIVGDGKGTATAKEFYKRHHRWTEGLISAAKAVGWGAKVLVDSADKVVQGKGKFEEIMVSSNEITASTAQLVAASRVKAQRGSSKLTALQTASKDVVECAAGVVASAKTGAEMIEDSKTVPDYSKLTLTQTKRLEMNSQVRVLELESNLTKERHTLGQLRRVHYQLAAAEEEKSE